MAENRVIGRDNALPWHLPADLKRFKTLTRGHTVILGRKTFESIGGPLPERRIVVLTRDPGWRCAGVTVAHDLSRIAADRGNEAELFVAGGAQVYRLALPSADRVYLTVVHAAIEGDARFPELDPSEWTLVEDQRHEADDKNPHAYSFRTFERVKREKQKGKGDSLMG